MLRMHLIPDLFKNFRRPTGLDLKGHARDPVTVTARLVLLMALKEKATSVVLSRHSDEIPPVVLITYSGAQERTIMPGLPEALLYPIKDLLFGYALNLRSVDESLEAELATRNPHSTWRLRFRVSPWRLELDRCDANVKGNTQS